MSFSFKNMFQIPKGGYNEESLFLILHPEENNDEIKGAKPFISTVFSPGCKNANLSIKK